MILDLKKCSNYFRDSRVKDKEAIRRTDTDNNQALANLIDPYSLDADLKILLCKALRRLGFKTQVLTGVHNYHIRNRLTHTFEVVSIAVIIAKILGLNENLCRAIALGHDIGHTPFGHTGEEFISRITGKKFDHEVFGVVLAQHIERKGQGLNLTRQTLEGILYHSRRLGDLSTDDQVPLEYNVVMFADKIGYLFADINDLFFKSSILDIKQHPKFEKNLLQLGQNQRERVSMCIQSLIIESVDNNKISFSISSAAHFFNYLRDYMNRIYPQINTNFDLELEKVFNFLKNNFQNPVIILALMTDQEVLYLSRKKKISIEDIQGCSIYEILPFLDKDIDWSDPDLNW